MPLSSLPTAEALSERASSALANGGMGLSLTPALPAAWPPAGPDLVYFAYASEPLPSGVVAFKLTGPKAKVSFKLPDGVPIVEAMAIGETSGREAGSGIPDMRNAEQALLEVIAGNREPEQAKPDLSPYVKWSLRSAVMGADARKRHAEFFAWLDAKD